MSMSAVEWKKLGDVIQVLRGRRLTKTELLEEGQYPVFHGGLEPLGYYNLSNREADSVMVINVGASAGTVGYCESDFWSSDGCFTLSKNPLLLPKYIFCYLKQEERKIASKVRKAGIPTLDAKVIEDINIPLIDVQRQQEIVSHLDTFTTLISNLESELDMRRKQYEHYRNQLLDFEGVEGVEWKTLGEVCDVFDGTHQTPQYTDFGVKFVSVENINDPYSSKKYISLEDYDSKYKTKPRRNDVLMTRIGDVGTCYILDKNEPIAYYVSLALLRPNSDFVTSGYIKDIVESRTGKGELRKRTLLTAVPLKINLGEISKIKIPIPSLSTQQEIVSKLDAFENLIQSLEQEIKLRKQQYEYYREKLLTFE